MLTEHQKLEWYGYESPEANFWEKWVYSLKVV